MGVSDDAYSQFFEQVDTEKQQRFDARISRDLLKFLGAPSALLSQYELEANQGGDGLSRFSPQWLSDQLNCPIVFSASKDYWIRKAGGVPELSWLFAHRIDSPKCRRVWNDLWLEARELYGAERYTAVCFRPPWAEFVLALHNYEPVLTHTTPPLTGASMVWRVNGELVILQRLSDVVTALLAKWTPTFT